MRSFIHNNWFRSADVIPQKPCCVLAWDGETHFIAVYDQAWVNAYLDEEIDSVITHWCELPEPEEAQR